MHFGEHLTIDGYGGNFQKLNDKELVLSFLKEIADMLEMKILLGPEIVEAPDTGHKDPGGWSGFVIIQESHISIHTFVQRGFLTADIYSCKNGIINVDLFKKYITEKFNLKDLETNFIKRGKKYPRENIY